MMDLLVMADMSSLCVRTGSSSALVASRSGSLLPLASYDLNAQAFVSWCAPAPMGVSEGATQSAEKATPTLAGPDFGSLGGNSRTLVATAGKKRRENMNKAIACCHETERALKAAAGGRPLCGGPCVAHVKDGTCDTNGLHVCEPGEDPWHNIVVTSPFTPWEDPGGIDKTP